MHVTHLYHSGFLIELGDRTLLFDWYPTSPERTAADITRFRRARRLYVFVSHEHHDHYAPEIWQLGSYLPGTEITYILDEAVALKAPDKGGIDLVSCEPEQIYTIDESMEVTTLNSTDEGIAFYVDVDGRTIYHGGDLSVWWWPERDRTLNEYSENACRFFLEILEGKHVELALLPITPRAGVEGDRGIELFMKKVGADVIVPMHYGDMRFEAIALAESDRLAPWHDKIRFDSPFEL